MYVLLLEKAFAKFAGSYDKLDGGFPMFALTVMTGCEDIAVYKRTDTTWKKGRIDLEGIGARTKNLFECGLSYYQDTPPVSQEEMFEHIKEFDEKNYIMSASIGGDEVEREREDGLVERHAYALISAKSCKGGTLHLVCCRNPWGNSKEWNGDWSDDSALWCARERACVCV